MVDAVRKMLAVIPATILAYEGCTNAIALVATSQIREEDGRATRSR